MHDIKGLVLARGFQGDLLPPPVDLEFQIIVVPTQKDVAAALPPGGHRQLVAITLFARFSRHVPLLLVMSQG